MKIIVYGAGVMANYVKEAIIKSGNEFVGFVDPFGKGDFIDLDIENVYYEGIIDFSHFSLIENVLKYASKKQVPLLIATTGHSKDQVEMIEKASKDIPIIKSTNTSLGINILNELVAYATRLLNDFDIEVIEKHHNRKIDAPSGTADTLIKIIKKNSKDSYDIIYGRHGNSKRGEKEIGLHSIRAGNIVGEHSVIFSKEDEIIEIKHEALSRKIFADGALKGILYLKGKKNGLYTMNDVLEIK